MHGDHLMRTLFPSPTGASPLLYIPIVQPQSTNPNEKIKFGLELGLGLGFESFDLDDDDGGERAALQPSTTYFPSPTYSPPPSTTTAATAHPSSAKPSTLFDMISDKDSFSYPPFPPPLHVSDNGLRPRALVSRLTLEVTPIWGPGDVDLSFSSREGFSVSMEAHDQVFAYRSRFFKEKLGGMAMGIRSLWISVIVRMWKVMLRLWASGCNKLHKSTTLLARCSH